MTKATRSAAPTKEANGSWSFVVDLGPGPDGKGVWRERRQARRRGFPTKRDAQQALDALRVSSRQGTYVAPARQSVKEWLEVEWLPTQRRELAESTWASYERNLRHHVIPAIGGVQLQALDAGHLNRLYTTLLASGRLRGTRSAGLSARTTRYIHTIVHAALDDAVRLRRVPINAADQATPPSAKSAKSPEMHTWDVGELATFLHDTADDRYGAAWAFAALTGCRRGEVLGVRWSDLDLDARSASLRQQVLALDKASGVGTEARVVPGTKTADSRVIELDEATVSMLRAWRRRQAKERLLLGVGFTDLDLVFPRADGRPEHPDIFTKAFDRRVRANVSVSRIRLHDLRHTWATLALEAGVDIAVVSKQLGHSSPTITWNTYQHVRKGVQAGAVERVASLIFGGGAS